MNTPRRINIIRTLLTVVVLLSVNSISAQNFGLDPNRRTGIDQIPDYNQMNEPQDKDTTTKKPKVRKPLESFYFSDSLRLQRIFAWTVSLDNNDITTQVVDTLLPNFQLDYPFMRKDVGNIYLGNVGSATMPINYFRRTTPLNFSFVDAWNAYIMRPEQVLFYNSKMPYSRLSYEMSGAIQFEESLFDFILSHNVSPSTSFNFEYKADGTKGLYTHQKTLVRYVDLSLAHTGKRYAVHGGYIYNHGVVDENGGLVNDADIDDPEYAKPRDLSTNLNSANNTFKGHTFWFTQSYGIPLRKQREDELTIQKIPTAFLGTSAEYSTFAKVYRDNGEMGFYDTAYISKTASKDSISQTRLDLKLFAQIQPYNRDGILGLLTGGIGNETNTYFSDTVATAHINSFGNGGQFVRNTTYLYGSAEGAFRKYLRWGASLRYNLFGFRNSDFTMRGNIQTSAYIKERPLTLDASIQFSLQEPDVWAQNYFSNHFAWANSFEKESSTTINARFLVPSAGLEIGGNYQIVNNKVYFDSLSMPAQYGKPMSIFGAYLQKNFHLGGFRLNHRALMQWSTQQEIVPVPAFSAFLSYFYEFDVKKDVLRMEVGFDGRFNTKYYAFGYNPAISQFYNQREKEIGNYPYIDAFAAAKWKRMRILVKLQHLNADMLKNKEYFLVNHYPANKMMFKLGVSWSFYD